MASPDIKKHEMNIPNKLAFVLYDVLTKEECDEYIKKTEKLGYEAALINIGCGQQKLMKNIRKSSRCIWDSKEEADKLWKKIESFVPRVFQSREVCGLNERLRFLKYDPGEYFKPHYDGEYRRDNGERSLITMMLYLNETCVALCAVTTSPEVLNLSSLGTFNEGFKGGSTTFFYKETEPEGVPCVPRTGSVLIFQHDILHEGSELIEGRKYAVRTDVMYSKESAADELKTVLW